MNAKDIVEYEIEPVISNFSLSTYCPGCGEEMDIKYCKSRCKQCGFFWDCSEL